MFAPINSLSLCCSPQRWHPPRLAVTVYPVHIDYEKELWQYTPLSESNKDNERLWFNSADKETNFWAEIQRLDGQQQAVVKTVLPKHSPKLFTRNLVAWFVEVDKRACVFGIFPRCLENFLERGNSVCIGTAEM